MTLFVSITHHSFCVHLADNQQTQLLTDFTLISLVGNCDLAKQLVNQLQSTVKPSFDLKRCGEVLDAILEPHRDHVANLDKRTFEVVITGFYSNGRTGEITLGSGNSKINELIYPLRGSNEYLFTFIPPNRSLFRSTELLLELPDDDPTTLENYTDHLISVVYPTIYTLYPDNVHQAGQLLALEKSKHPKRQPFVHNMSVDISEILHSFPTREEIEQILFQQDD